ncbi:hypothetical protein SK128_003291, partial [Halocaridina rubra]
KKNKVNKEKAPQIIPTSPDKNNTRAVPQAKAENTMDESEVQSWRRPSSIRKSQQDDKNLEVPRTISTSARVNNKEIEEPVANRISSPEKDESSLSATREKLKARSCPVLSQLEEEEVKGGGGGGGGVWPQTRPHSRTEGIPTPLSSSSSISPLIKYQRLSSSDLNIPSVQVDPSSAHTPVKTPKKINNHLINAASARLCTSLTYSPAKATCITKTNASSDGTQTLTCKSDLSADSSLTTTTALVPANVTTTAPSGMGHMAPLHSIHKPLGSSMSTPVLTSPGILSSVPSLLPPSVSPSSTPTTATITTSTTAGLASLSTNTSTNNKDPRLLARSASLRERIQRNHVDSMARVTPIPEPLVSSSSTVLTTTTNTSSPMRSIGRSFVPPSRDEESETQRKAHAKMVRSTRRSTQGVTLEDIKSAEQLMKNKQQQQASTSSPEAKESSSSAPSVSTSIPQVATTTTTTTTPSSPNKTEEDERRPSWRLKVDDADKTKFCLENVRSKDKPEEEYDTVTVQLRKKNPEEKGDEDQKDSERSSQTREGTQAAIQRRKKPKRRSTGRVQVNMDEIDPEKRAQRLAEQQQQQQQQDDNGSDEGEEEEDSSSTQRCYVTQTFSCQLVDSIEIQVAEVVF